MLVLVFRPHFPHINLLDVGRVTGACAFDRHIGSIDVREARTKKLIHNERLKTRYCYVSKFSVISCYCRDSVFYYHQIQSTAVTNGSIYDSVKFNFCKCISSSKRLQPTVIAIYSELETKTKRVFNFHLDVFHLRSSQAGKGDTNVSNILFIMDI